MSLSWGNVAVACTLSPKTHPVEMGGGRHPGERSPVNEERKGGTIVNTMPWASKSHTCSQVTALPPVCIWGSTRPHLRAARARKQEALVFSQRAPEDTLGLMDTVTQATIQVAAGDQTTLQGQWRDRTGQGSLKRSTAEGQGPACRDPCPDGTPGPPLFIFLEPLWVRPLPDGLAVASLPYLSQMKVETIWSFWRHATQETPTPGFQHLPLFPGSSWHAAQGSQACFTSITPNVASSKRLSLGPVSAADYSSAVC